MRKLILLSSLVLALSAPAIPRAGAALIYRNGEGWVSDSADAGEAEKTASAQLHKAEALEASGSITRAISAYRTLLRKFPDTGAGPKAQLKIAQLSETTKEPERAFNEYNKYVTRYPRGDDFDKCVEAQFRIAGLFLNGEKRKLFGMKTFSSMERAQEMFQEIVKNAPYSKFAGLAQFNIGQALEKQGKGTEAIAAYQQVVDKYPADQIAGDAQYQIGYIQLQASNKGSNDKAAHDKARDAFEDFMMKYPASEKVNQAKDNIVRLSGADLKKTLGIAEFYEKTRNFKAAAIYYGEVIRGGASSPEAVVAQKRLEKLKLAVGEAALNVGTIAGETGATAEVRRKTQARVDTASRPDYVGPPAPPAPPSAPVPDEVPPQKPQLRTFGGMESAPEPALPAASGSASAPLAPSPLMPGAEPSLPAQ